VLLLLPLIAIHYFWVCWKMLKINLEIINTVFCHFFKNNFSHLSGQPHSPPAVQQPIQQFNGKMEMPATEEQQQQPPLASKNRDGHRQRGMPFLISQISVCHKKLINV
jgi:hypothetical protein